MRLDVLTILSHWSMLLAFPLLSIAALIYWRRTRKHPLAILGLSSLLVAIGLLLGTIADWPAMIGGLTDYSTPPSAATFRLQEASVWLVTVGNLLALVGAIATLSIAIKKPDRA